MGASVSYCENEVIWHAMRLAWCLMQSCCPVNVNPFSLRREPNGKEF